MNRTKIYKLISEELGWEYHTAKIRSVAEGELVYEIAERVVFGAMK